MKNLVDDVVQICDRFVDTSALITTNKNGECHQEMNSSSLSQLLNNNKDENTDIDMQQFIDHYLLLFKHIQSMRSRYEQLLDQFQQCESYLASSTTLACSNDDTQPNNDNNHREKLNLLRNKVYNDILSKITADNQHLYSGGLDGSHLNMIEYFITTVSESSRRVTVSCQSPEANEFS